MISPKSGGAVMAAAATTQDLGGQLDIGWVVGATFRALRGRWLDLLIVGAPFILLPEVLVNLLPDEVSKIANLATGLPALVFTGAATLIVYRDLSGGAPVTAADAIGKGASRFGSLWGVAFISGVGIVVGAILLIVPGVFLMIAWMPASAAVMVENKTAFEALDRAWRLTRGARWKLLGLSGIFLVAVLLLFGVLLIASVALGMSLGVETGTTVAKLVVVPIWTLAVTVLLTVFPTAAYAGLRRAKEGDAGDVSAVFA